MSRSISCLLTWGCNNILHGVRRLLYFLHHEQLNVSRSLWFRLPPALMPAGRPEGRLDDRWGAACVTDVSLLLLLCRGTSTRRRTRRCCTEWRVCPAWAGCWRRASTRTNWSQNGRLLRRWRVDLFSNQDVFIHKWQVIYISHPVNFWGSSIEVIVRFLLFINVLIVADHRCFDNGITCCVFLGRSCGTGTCGWECRSRGKAESASSPTCPDRTTSESSASTWTATFM